MPHLLQSTCQFAIGLSLAFLSLGISLRAQTQVSVPPRPPIVLDSMEVAKLVVDRTLPKYPPVAKVNYLQGRVSVEASVSAEGKVVREHVTGGNPILAASALEAIRQWRFRPLMTPGGPAGFVTPFKVEFSLRAPLSRQLPPNPEKALPRGAVPPRLLTKSALSSTATIVHARVLVDAEGKAIDYECFCGPVAHNEEVRQLIMGLSFRPAQWGNTPVPGYAEIDLPFAEKPSQETANAFVGNE